MVCFRIFHPHAPLRILYIHFEYYWAAFFSGTGDGAPLRQAGNVAGLPFGGFTYVLFNLAFAAVLIRNSRYVHVCYTSYSVLPILLFIRTFRDGRVVSMKHRRDCDKHDYGAC